MSNKPPYSSLRIGPATSTRTIMFHQAVADRLGLNPTDHKCLLFLIEGAKSPGELSQMTGLSTGAMTAVIDRLEAAGFARRQPDSTDRRSVRVEIVPENLTQITRLFQSLGRAMGRLESRYSEQELAVIQDYLERAGEVLYQETLKLRQE